MVDAGRHRYTRACAPLTTVDQQVEHRRFAGLLDDEEIPVVELTLLQHAVPVQHRPGPPTAQAPRRDVEAHAVNRINGHLGLALPTVTESLRWRGVRVVEWIGMRPRVLRALRAVFWVTVTVWVTGGGGGACSDPDLELLRLRPPLRLAPARPRPQPKELERASGSWGLAEDGLACRFVEVRSSGGQPYLIMQIRNDTDVDRMLANELPMGRPSGSYSKFVEVRTQTVWTPITDPRGRILLLDESQGAPGTGAGGGLRVPARGIAQQRIVEFWVPTGGSSPIAPRGAVGRVVHLRGELRWFDWRQGDRKWNHRASCPPLVTRWVRWR